MDKPSRLWRFRIRFYPELLRFPSDDERAAAMRAANYRAWSRLSARLIIAARPNRAALSVAGDST